MCKTAFGGAESTDFCPRLSPHSGVRRYVKNKAYMAGQTAPGGDFPASWPNFGAEALAVAGSRHLAQRRFF